MTTRSNTHIVGRCLDDEIPGAVNLRDLGGQKAGTGRIRFGLLFRSGITHEIAPEGIRRLREEHGIRRVLDLRSNHELERDGLGAFADHGIEFHHVAVYGVTALTPDDQVARFRQMLSREYDWGERYKTLVSEHPESFAGMVRMLAKPGAFPAIFHCSAGRDRTGVLAAFVLEVLGVSREDIAADYARTGPHLRRHAHRYVRMKEQMSFTTEDMATALDTDPAHMRGFMDWVEATYGGAEGFLLANGVTARELGALRAELLERS